MPLYPHLWSDLFLSCSEIKCLFLTLEPCTTMAFCTHLHKLMFGSSWVKGCLWLPNWNSLFLCSTYFKTSIKSLLLKTFLIQCITGIEGSNRKINALAHTQDYFVYQIEYPHTSDLSVLWVVVPACRLLSGLKQMKKWKKGTWIVLLQSSAPLVPELWLFLTHSQVFSTFIAPSYQPAAVQLVVACCSDLPAD